MRRFSNLEMVMVFSRLSAGHTRWLEDYGSGRLKKPDDIVSKRKQELAVLQQAQEDYRTAAEREEAT